MAKEVVMRYGPDFYRKDSIFIIMGSTNCYSVVSEPNFVVYFNKDGLPYGVFFLHYRGMNVTNVFKSYLAQKYYNTKKYNGIDYKKLIESEVVEPIKYPIMHYYDLSEGVKKSIANNGYYLVNRIDSAGSITIDTIKTAKGDRPTFRRVLIDEKIVGKDTVRRYKAVPIDD